MMGDTNRIFSHLKENYQTPLVILLFFLVWQFSVMVFKIPEFILPSPLSALGHLLLRQHVRQGTAGLQGPEPRARIGAQPAAAVREGGERPRRRAAPGQRGARRTGGVLAGQPVAKMGCVQAVGRVDAGAVRVLEQRPHVTEVGPDGVRRQRALGAQVALEGRERFGHLRRQRALDVCHGPSVHP